MGKGFNRRLRLPSVAHLFGKGGKVITPRLAHLWLGQVSAIIGGLFVDKTIRLV